MKTPRDILFARHQTIAPKLDTIRHGVVNVEFVREGRRVAVPKYRVAGTATLPLLIWRELILPCRRIWTGLAAVWILIFAVNLLQRDPSEFMARKVSSPTPEMISAFRQQQRLLAELIGQNEMRTAEPRKTFLPRPHTELGDRILTT